MPNPMLQLSQYALPLLVLAAIGCNPQEGGSCRGDEASCADPQTQLVCDEGTFQKSPCRGPAGCKADPETGVACDISGNKPGDPCAAGEAGVAVCKDDKTLLVCRNKKYQFEPCRGSSGCDNSGGRATCDRSIAKVGDACQEEGIKACGADDGAVLHCVGGSMTLLFHCRGPEGCTLKEKLSCDFSVAEKGDVCDAQMEGASACTPDRSAIVSCRGGKFVDDEGCKEPMRCGLEGGPHCAKPETG